MGCGIGLAGALSVIGADSGCTADLAPSTEICDVSRGPERSQRQTGHEAPVWRAPSAAPATAGPLDVAEETGWFGAAWTWVKSTKTASMT